MYAHTENVVLFALENDKMLFELIKCMFSQCVAD